MAKKPPLYPHVPKSKLGAFLCGQCPLRFHSSEELNQHLEEQHPEALASMAPESQGADIEIERYHGMVVAVGGINTKTPMLPDWDISYVVYPQGRMAEFRDALTRARVRIVQVTDERIYFEQK